MPKHVIYGPVIFAVAGAACGVSGAILLYYNPLSAQVHLEDSVPLAILGGGCGLIVGFFAEIAHSTSLRLRPWVEAVATAVLSVSIFAMLGCLGIRQPGTPPPSMIWGAVIGSAIGLWAGVARIARTDGGSTEPPSGEPVGTEGRTP
jgi:hypothetical protein